MGRAGAGSQAQGRPGVSGRGAAEGGTMGRFPWLYSRSVGYSHGGMTYARPRAIALLASLFGCQGCAGEPPRAPSVSRQEFAKKLALIAEGMPASEVEAILGKPDDVRTRYDLGGILTTRTLEIWRYGTDGHLTFPTLGQVFIDVEHKAQYIHGGRDEPPDPAVFGEDELRRLLRVIDRAPAISGWEYNPLPLIEVVNALQPLGKAKALMAIDEYFRVASSHDWKATEGGLFLVLRVLFEVPANPGHMPPMNLGATSTPNAEDPTRVPRFPIALVDDIPLLLISGYIMSGPPVTVEKHFAHFRERGTLRSRPLVPTDTPLGVLEKLEETLVLLHPGPKELLDHDRAMLCNQLLRLVEPVYRLKSDRPGAKFIPGGDADLRWKKIVEDVSRLNVRWDRVKGYAFKDGSQLPEEKRRLYRREIWDLPGLGESTLILERRDGKYVDATLERTIQAGAPASAWSLRLFAVNDKSKDLAGFPRAQDSGSSVTATAGETAFSSESSLIVLPDGLDIQAELKMEGRAILSPVYRP